MMWIVQFKWRVEIYITKTERFFLSMIFSNSISPLWRFIKHSDWLIFTIWYCRNSHCRVLRYICWRNVKLFILYLSLKNSVRKSYYSLGYMEIFFRTLQHEKFTNILLIDFSFSRNVFDRNFHTRPKCKKAKKSAEGARTSWLTLPLCYHITLLCFNAVSK